MSDFIVLASTLVLGVAGVTAFLIHAQHSLDLDAKENR